jgi:hypothetical protein
LLRLPVLAFTTTYDTRLGLPASCLAVIVMCSAEARLARLAEVLFEFDDAPAGWYALLAMVPVLLRWWLRTSVRNLLVLIAVGVVALGSPPSTGLVPIVGMVTCARLLRYRRHVRPALFAIALPCPPLT